MNDMTKTYYWRDLHELLDDVVSKTNNRSALSKTLVNRIDTVRSLLPTTNTPVQQDELNKFSELHYTILELNEALDLHIFKGGVQ